MAKGAAVGHHLDILDDEMIVEGQADAHIVQRFARLDLAAILVGKAVGLAVGHAAFDVPEAVLAAEALEFITPVVQMLALGRGAERGMALFLLERAAPVRRRWPRPRGRAAG